MTKKMLINATQSEEIRVAIVEESGSLFDLDIESSHRLQKKANIYNAKVSRIEKSLNAIFVDYGAERHGFLPMKELAPEYVNKDGSPNLKEGQEILIQIEKEERGNKGAAVTSFITLAGCYLVLMPNSNKSGGVSRRIEGSEREQLKETMSKLTVPNKMSAIARTACLGRSQEELQWDLDSLLKLWETICEENTKHEAPFLIYQESDVIMRSVRDYLRQDIDEIVVDERKTYERVLQAVKTLRPDFESQVRFYHHDIGLFTYSRIESQIETAFLRELKLPSGGAIVIDHTEALTSIDINSSRATKGSDIEETAVNTNIEAAREIARQMKLRDLGGLLVIDFIDMDNSKNQRLVEEELNKAVASDRARIQIGKISRFGLLELSRQRLRPSLEEGSAHTCPRCNGQGTIRSVESIALSIIRLIQEESMRADTQAIHLELPLNLLTFLGNEKRHLITQIETQNKIEVVLIPNPNLESPNYQMNRLTKQVEDGKPSYKMQEPQRVETYSTTANKAGPLEQPAIRSLSIEKAPTSSALKRTLSGLISKIQQVFIPPEETKPARKNLNIKNKVSHQGRGRNQNQRRDRNDTNTRNPEGRNDNRRQNDRRRNNNDRNRSAERPQDQQQVNQTEQTAPTAERPASKPTQEPRNRRPNERPNKSAQTESNPKPQKEAVVVVTTPVIEKSAPPASKISPAVEAILSKSTVSANTKQVESANKAEAAPVKLKREEVVTKTEFSAEQAREIVQKQNEQKSTRVETAVDQAAQTTQKYTKQEQVI